jgi:hypothetical protein
MGKMIVEKLKRRWKVLLFIKQKLSSFQRFLDRPIIEKICDEFRVSYGVTIENAVS